jgi:hypothetical protein
MEYLKIFTEVMVGLSWPIVVFIVVYLFRKNIAELADAFRDKIKELTHAGPEGFNFSSKCVQGEQDQNKVAQAVSEIAKKDWRLFLDGRVIIWAKSRGISDAYHLGTKTYEQCLKDLGLSEEIRNILNPNKAR